MKNMLNINKLKTSHILRAINRIDLLDQTSDHIRSIADEFHQARQPFYRIWYYNQQGWATGYTDEAMKFLKHAFNRIKKNEETCQQVLNTRRRVMKL